MASVSTFDAVMRFGFAGRGLAYLIAGLALLAAGQASDPAELLQGLGEARVGRAGLLLVALGLFGYGVLGWTSGMLRLETVPVRLSRFVSGVLHAGVALYAIFLASGGGHAGERMFAHLSGDPRLTTILGAMLALAGLWQLVVVWRANFLRHLLPAAHDAVWLVWSGRTAYLGRGLAFLLVGLFLWNVHIAGAAESLRAASAGELSIAAIGLIAFGLFSLLEAAYGRIAPRTG